MVDVTHSTPASLGSEDVAPRVVARRDVNKEARFRRAVQLMYRQLLVTVVAATVIAIALLLVAFRNVLFTSGPPQEPPSILLVTIVGGVLGALFSSLIRLYRYEDLPAAMTNIEIGVLGEWHFRLYSLVPILVGAIAACVLYLILASQLVTGPLFPAFGCLKDKDCNSFLGLTYYWGPQGAIDFAKAIVWGFIAGFAERLVPDTLASFSRRVEVATVPSEPTT
jgi:hypothetical protein